MTMEDLSGFGSRCPLGIWHFHVPVEVMPWRQDKNGSRTIKVANLGNGMGIRIAL